MPMNMTEKGSKPDQANEPTRSGQPTQGDSSVDGSFDLGEFGQAIDGFENYLTDWVAATDLDFSHVDSVFTSPDKWMPHDSSADDDASPDTPSVAGAMNVDASKVLDEPVNIGNAMKTLGF